VAHPVIHPASSRTKRTLPEMPKDKVPEPVADAPVSALAVPIAVPPGLARLRDRWDQTGARPHVTVMYPFLPCAELGPSVRADLAVIAGRVAPFEVRFERHRRFTDLVWIEPRPSGPFAVLTAGVTERWPIYRPYGGEFETVIHHLTVVEDDTAPLSTVEEVTKGVLPFAARAERLELWCQDANGRWRARWRIPLGLRR
jgi:hypothetical protein